jgi:RNA polymerase sigma-70 factor (ECF subfamily)
MSTLSQKLISDEQLVVQLQLGNQNAMGELYIRYHMLVFSKCLSFTKNTDDANDLAQDVMIRVMEKIGSFKAESKFSTWLYAITFNYCTDKLRKAKGKYFESVHEHFDIEDHSASELEIAREKNHKENKAGKALMAISEEDQQLLLMKYQLDKSIYDLQCIYNLSASAVKMRLLRAKEKAVTFYCSYSSAAA